MMTNTPPTQICNRCNEAPAVTYNEDRCEAVCETCAAFYDRHNCTGDNCYCIGGDENLDNMAALQDDYEAYCLNRVAPLGGD